MSISAAQDFNQWYKSIEPSVSKYRPTKTYSLISLCVFNVFYLPCFQINLSNMGRDVINKKY